MAYAIVASAVMALVALPACGSGAASSPADDASTSAPISVAALASDGESSSAPAERRSEDTSEEASQSDVAEDAAEAPDAFEEESAWQAPEPAAAAPAAAAAVESQQAASDSGSSQPAADPSPATADASQQSPAPSQQQSAKQGASKSESSQPGSQKPTTEKQKKWVDAVYETVEHPEEGHYESVVVGQRYFCLCGQEVASPEGWKQHRADFIASNGGKCNGQHVSYTMEDIVEEQYVVDSPAWSEQVLVSEGHWE